MRKDPNWNGDYRMPGGNLTHYVRTPLAPNIPVMMSRPNPGMGRTPKDRSTSRRLRGG